MDTCPGIRCSGAGLCLRGLTGYRKVIHEKMSKLMFMDNAFHGEVFNKSKKAKFLSFYELICGHSFITCYVIYLLI